MLVVIGVESFICFDFGFAQFWVCLLVGFIAFDLVCVCCLGDFSGFCMFLFLLVFGFAGGC